MNHQVSFLKNRKFMMRLLKALNLWLIQKNTMERITQVTGGIGKLVPRSR